MYTFHKIAVIFQFGFSAIVFISLFFVNAPYGKFSRGGWGTRISAKTAWIVMELPAVLTIAVWGWVFRSSMGASWIFLLLWEFHYLYRILIFSLRMKKHNRRSFPVSILFTAVFFNIINGFINGFHLFGIHPVEGDWFGDPRFILGALMFAGGFLIHADSDWRIQSQKPAKGNYIIPEGGMFRWVSSPSYLGEIIQWFGWAVLTWSPAGLAFAMFTFANIFPRGIAGHKWYQANFENYPPERKAIIPGIL